MTGGDLGKNPPPLSLTGAPDESMHLQFKKRMCATRVYHGTHGRGRVTTDEGGNGTRREGSRAAKGLAGQRGLEG